MNYLKSEQQNTHNVINKCDKNKNKMKYLVDNFKPAKLPILFRFENINSVQCGKIITFLN